MDVGGHGRYNEPEEDGRSGRHAVIGSWRSGHSTAMFHAASTTLGSGGFVFVLFVVAAAALGIFGYLQGQKRRQELEAMARQRGWSFSPDRDPEISYRFGSFPCLERGANRYAYNIMEGQERNWRICGFDYHYRTGSGKNTHHHHFSAIVVHTGLPLQSLSIRPEGIFDRISEFLGFDDIDFESSEFSRRFHVQGPDRKWAFDVLHQETMEFLLSMPAFSIEMHGPHVMAYRSDRFSVRDYEDALQVLVGILDRLPRYLLREMKGVD